MPVRSITDEEIALIKAMLSRGMANKDIQFYFNRPTRAVNSGRITEIGEGSYSDSNDIPAASEDELDDFLKEQKLATSLSKIEGSTKFEVGKITSEDFSSLRTELDGYVGSDVTEIGNKTKLPITSNELEIIRLSLQLGEKSSDLPQWSVGTIHHLRGLKAVLTELNSTLMEAGKTAKILLPLSKLVTAIITKLQGILEAVKPVNDNEPRT